MSTTPNSNRQTNDRGSGKGAAECGLPSFAELAYARIGDILQLAAGNSTANTNRLMHETLVYVCHEALKDSRQNYGNLFSQVDFLCKRHNVRLSDRIEIQSMRRSTNRAEQLSEEETKYCLRALCRFVSAITATHIPDLLLRSLPANGRPYANTEGDDVSYVRCIVRRWDEKFIYVYTESVFNGITLAVDHSDEDLIYIKDLLKEGMQLNLIDCKISAGKADKSKTPDDAERIVKPGLIIIEPDYLLDISTVASCFKEYGRHPLTYIIERMKAKANSSAILMGNLAGQILDETINHGDSFNMAETLRDSFRGQALEYASCMDFDAAKFKAEAANQAENIRKAASVMFEDDGRAPVVLEPSFICERLGLQGRADMMTTDFRLLVEQKSGKNMNIDYGRTGKHGSKQPEPHYVQLLLYYGVLRYNFNLGNDRTDIRLLYSKYAPENGLMAVAFYRRLFRDAIRMRNEITALCFNIAYSGFDTILPDLSPQTLNTTGCSSMFYNKYLLPQMESITRPLHGMPAAERDYLCRMMTFVFREQLLGKVGHYEGSDSCAADLWNMPLSEKKETGNIYLGLTIKAKECTAEGRATDRIRLRVPEQDCPCLPNFRRGDMVYLYPYAAGKEPDVRQSILYKGTITGIRTEEITVTLSNGQKDKGVLKIQNADNGNSGNDSDVLYAVEHAGSDATANNAVSWMHTFITAPKERRDLLLGRRKPEKDCHAALTRSYNKSYDDILLGIKQAKDYYLLSGPPGTGKTSMALRFMVEEELTDNAASILLMAYTNRAVDEICGMLDNAGLDYIRIGSEHSAGEQYKGRLLSELAKTLPKLNDIRLKLTQTRIMVCTTSTLMSRPFLFNIKAFSLAIIDEASQITEPNIIGLLAAHGKGYDGTDNCRIRKFVLVGDHKQLPAVVRQNEKESSVTEPALLGMCLDNCRNSLFERLLRMERKAGRKDFTGVLRRHGRMHPEIAKFPCLEFYTDEQLTAVPLGHQRERKLRYADSGSNDTTDLLLRNHRMIFIPSAPCSRPDISDKVNTAEAATVADLLQRIYRMTGDEFNAEKSVGVIVPYRNQIAMIRQEIEKTGISELERVSIDTVERYQGSQRDVIIYSFTVQKPWQLDFLTANTFIENGHTIDRKLNVAMTRARRQMIITGNEHTLAANPLFRRMISFIREQGGAL